MTKNVDIGRSADAGRGSQVPGGWRGERRSRTRSADATEIGDRATGRTSYDHVRGAGERIARSVGGAGGALCRHLFRLTTWITTAADWTVPSHAVAGKRAMSPGSDATLPW